MNKEKKILIKFLAITVLALGLGFLMGYNSMAFEKDIAGQLTYLFSSMVEISPVLMMLGWAFMGVAIMYCNKGKTAAAVALAGDDEEKYEKAEKLLGNAITITNWLNIYMFCVFGIMASGFGTGYSMDSFLPVMTTIAAFMILLLGGAFLQNIIVKQIQKLNPEKQGSVLDTKFHKEWFDSCDEAERAQIGHAAYKSYRATTNALVATMLIAIFISMITPTGPLPAVLVCSVWAVQFFSYTKAAKQYTDRK